MEAEIPMAGEALNVKRLILLMQKVNSQFDEGKTEIDIYCEMYHEWCKLFKHFGNAIVVAFKGKNKFTINTLYYRHC